MKKIVAFIPIGMLAFILSTNISAASESELRASFNDALAQRDYQRAQFILNRMGQEGYYEAIPDLQMLLFETKAGLRGKAQATTPSIPTPPSGPFITPPAPPAPPMPEAPIYKPQEPQGDLYAHLRAILAKPSLGLVDRRTLEMELENPNLPNDLRQAINAKLGNVPTPPPAPAAPPMPEAPIYKPQEPQGDLYAHLRAILAKPSLGLVDRRTLEMELENPNLPNDLRQAIDTKLGNVPTPPPAPPAPPAPPMPGEQTKPAGAFKWVQDAQGNWQRVPATEGEQKPAEDEDLGLRGLFGE